MSTPAMNPHPQNEKPETAANVVHLHERFSDAGSLSPEHRQRNAYELATDLLFTDLIHEHPSLHGEELAHAIATALTPPRNDDSETTRLHVAILELISAEADTTRSKNEPDYVDIFDEKYDHDPIFQVLVNILRDTSNRSKQFEEQRKGVLRLQGLRELGPDFTTTRDAEWEAVIERIFS